MTELITTPYTGTTPSGTLNLAPGSYVVKINKAGYREFQGKYTIADQDEKTVNADLVPEHGTLTITSVPAGATVTITAAQV